MTKLHPDEQRFVNELRAKIDALAVQFNKIEGRNSSNLAHLFAFLQEVKEIAGNTSIDLSACACLLAKDYLHSRHDIAPHNALLKAQGAPGIDIDLKDTRGKRIVAEIKTTTPYQSTDFGAQQRVHILKDLHRLATIAADHKYMFVTDPKSFEVLGTKYRQQLTGIKLVLLGSR